jgi:hypothetical protein
MTDAPFVPDDFVVPLSLDGPGFRLEPLGPQHNERDHAAWMSSIDHITETPGFPTHGWPAAMSPEANLHDLERHADDFSSRRGFAYTVLDGDDVIGCVYIYPADDDTHDASVRSWVTASRADLDRDLWLSVNAWLDAAWPFTTPGYDRRP